MGTMDQFKQTCESYDRWINHVALNMMAHYDHLSGQDWEDSLKDEVRNILMTALEYWKVARDKKLLYESVEQLTIKDARQRVMEIDAAHKMWELLPNDSSAFVENPPMVVREGGDSFKGQDRLVLCLCDGNIMRLEYGGKVCNQPLTGELSLNKIRRVVIEMMDLYRMHRENIERGIK